MMDGGIGILSDPWKEYELYVSASPESIGGPKKKFSLKS